MIFPALFLLSFQPGPMPSIVCQNNQTVQTAPLRSAAGFTAVLSMHSEDDHGKNTHLCETDYSLEIFDPDGSSLPSAEILRSDDSWGRPLLFRIDGFSPDGNRAFLFIYEGQRKTGLIDAAKYNISSGNQQGVFFKPPRDLSPACVATLHIFGTTRSGLMVLATSIAGGCAQEKKWQLNPNKRRNKDGGTLPEYPEPLSSGTGIARLDPGSATQH